MSNALHPLTELMLARMKSHPEEFTEDDRIGLLGDWTHGRWRQALSALREHGTEADKQAIEDGLRPLRLNAAHEWAMDELLNGEERRRKQKEDEAYYMLTLAQQQQIMNASMQSQIPYGQATATGILGGIGPSLASPSNTTTPSILNRAKRKLGI